MEENAVTRTRDKGPFYAMNALMEPAQNSEWNTHLKSQTRQIVGLDDNERLQLRAFTKAMVATFSRSAEGALTPYLFYDPPAASIVPSSKNLWGSKKNVPFGAAAWDAHIANSTNQNKAHEKQNEYTFSEGDVEILKYAVNDGLTNRLTNDMTYYSYGPGETIAVKSKDCLLIEEIFKQRGEVIRAYNAVDINRRYTRDAALLVHKTFDLTCNGLNGDFMEGNITLGPRDGSASLIAVFGGPIANAPKVIEGGIQLNSKQKAAEYLARMTKQHGMGTHLVMTVDVENDKQSLLKNYAKTKEFEAFVLSAFPRAVHQGVIKNENYDVFQHWELATRYDTNDDSVKLMAKCKAVHDLKIEDKTFTIKRGEEFPIILSNKWQKEDLENIFKASGYSDFKMYDKPGSSKKLISARWLNDPNLNIL